VGQQAALAAVSERLLSATALIGSAEEIASRLREWQALGLDEPLLSLPQSAHETVAPRLEALARALGLAGA
jgi:alkanesulfonate monooxygenase SsuD/methylene tetrahydromethanopterin reductase-like flavin-dependent oxidoreductase (luciferase family)